MAHDPPTTAGISTRRLLVVTKKLLRLVGVMWLASVLTFLLSALLPANPAVAILGPDRGAEEYARVNAELGLDEPLVTRYFSWLGNLLRGDLGTSLVPPNEEVSAQLARALPVSLELALLAMVLSLLIAIPIAMFCAYNPGGRVDRIVTASAFAMISMPQFLLGLLLILVLVSQFDLFPRFGWATIGEDGLAANLYYAALPIATIAAVEVAMFARLLRADLIKTLGTDFVRSARVRGLHPRRILIRHALRPSSFTLITLAGVNLGRLIGSTVVVERVFGISGVGTLLVDGATSGDLPVVQGVVLMIAIVYVLINGAIDVLYTWLDPRTRRSGR